MMYIVHIVIKNAYTNCLHKLVQPASRAHIFVILNIGFRRQTIPASGRHLPRRALAMITMTILMAELVMTILMAELVGEFVSPSPVRSLPILSNSFIGMF